MKRHIWSCDDPAGPCLCVDEPRVLVVSRHADHDRWRRLLGPAAQVVTPGRPLYGSRFDVVIEDLPVPRDPDWPRIEKWFDQEVRCRLGRTGKIFRSWT